LAHHVVILRREHVAPILDGHKTVESRLTRNRVAPFGLVAPGDHLFPKVAGQRYFAAAVASDVDSHDNLTPATVDQLKARYNDRVLGDDDYWQAKRDARYATFITLIDVVPTNLGPAYNKTMAAWHVLPDAEAPGA